MMLALMLYFIIVGHKTFLKSMAEILSMCRYFSQRIRRMNICCSAPSRYETSLLFCNDFFCLWQKYVWEDLQHDLSRMAVRIVVL